jgi:hypothetical protein
VSAAPPAGPRVTAPPRPAPGPRAAGLGPAGGDPGTRAWAGDPRGGWGSRESAWDPRAGWGIRRGLVWEPRARTGLLHLPPASRGRAGGQPRPPSPARAYRGPGGPGGGSPEGLRAVETGEIPYPLHGEQTPDLVFFSKEISQDVSCV